MGKDDFDFLGMDFRAEKPKEEQKEKAISVSHRMGHRHLTRKAASEKALEEALDWYFQEGDCYHCFSFGDVDALTYLKHVLRQQPLDYVAISTWCMAGEDVLELERWHDRGMIGRIDFYVGEIFQGSYPEAYKEAVRVARKTGGRVVIFRNHAKVTICKGKHFDCLIESSANVNTNPRSENTVLTVDRQLVADYIALFAGIQSFDRSFDDVKPYTVEDTWR